MRKLGLAVVAVALFAVSAHAAALTLHYIAQSFRGGAFFGITASKTSGNILKGAYEASASIDFGSVTITCEDSAAITVTGAQVGDPCFVGIDSATVNAANSSFTCYALANQVKVRHCSHGSASNPAEAVYRVRVISSR